MPVAVGNLIGRIIGAGDGEVRHAPEQVFVCQTIVTSCFDWRGPRNKLLTDGLNFPSNDYIYRSLERQGARVVSVASPDGMTSPPNSSSMPSTSKPDSSPSPTSPSAVRICRISTPS